ncbi:MAG: hypothetical protein ACFFDF_06280 [Candidatus Odinarchaeota archaeon]
MRECYIFDIDGCVMPPIFSNFNENEPRIENVKSAIKNGNHVQLFPSFIEFYRKQCTTVESIFFITGRKYSEFGKLTENHLQNLSDFKDFRVIYYPERNDHKIQNYFAWKVKQIKGIIKNGIKSRLPHESSNRMAKFHIFDDMNDYFPKIRRIEDKWNVQIHLTLIESENNWKQLL